MLRNVALLTAVVLFTLAGCALEQYHFPTTQDKVPAAAILAFSEKYPNDVIKSITEQKMMDGKVQYTFVSTNPKVMPDRTTFITADGVIVDRKM
jgi:hypothetical protein